MHPSSLTHWRTSKQRGEWVSGEIEVRDNLCSGMWSGMGREKGVKGPSVVCVRRRVVRAFVYHGVVVVSAEG